MSSAIARAVMTMLRWARGLARPAALAALWLLAAAAAEAPAQAASSSWVTSPQTRVRLIAATAGVGGSRTLRLGLHFRLQPGWKIYWRSPGDAGYPPRLDWSGSENLAGAVLLWPVPQRFSVLGFTTLGYKNEVVLPVVATIMDPSRGARLRATVDFLSCDAICVPQQAKLVMDLPAGPAQNTRYAHLIGKFAARVPNNGPASGLSVESVRVSGGGATATLLVSVRGREKLEAPDLLVEGPRFLEFGKPTVRLSDGGHAALLTVSVKALSKKPPELRGAVLTLTVIDGERALEVTALAKGDVNSGARGGRSLLVVLGLALLGGLILNLMPCVLPVLSLKLLGMVSHGGGERRVVRRRFLASATGIVTSFLALAGFLALVRAAGGSVGWGIQFQEPMFLVAMVVILGLFAANLWGLFELRLPAALNGRLAGAGGKDGLGGDFMTGAFATLLATPCSAPFLGTAVGFALSAGLVETFAIFAALGVGMALPYLLVAAAPGLATALPRPGPWMIKLKAVLGGALAVTAIWLLSVLATQTGANVAWAVAALMLAALGVLWLRRRAPLFAGRRGVVWLVVLIGLSFAAPGRFGGDLPAATAMDTEWQRFDRAAIATLVSQGKTVFVDVTADWCLTCKANKSLVLGRGDVAARLADGRIVKMVADWTRPNEDIAAYLAAYGRYGIPFNVVYGPGAPDGIVLPELLTSGSVLAALDRAGGNRAIAKGDGKAKATK